MEGSLQEIAVSGPVRGGGDIKEDSWLHRTGDGRRYFVNKAIRKQWKSNKDENVHIMEMREYWPIEMTLYQLR